MRQRREIVVTDCPATGEATPTHAHMTERELARLSRTLVFFCRQCRQAHVVDPGVLRLPSYPGAASRSCVNHQERCQPALPLRGPTAS